LRRQPLAQRASHSSANRVAISIKPQNRVLCEISFRGFRELAWLIGGTSAAVAI
jgi:hypothetical protein